MTHNPRIGLAILAAVTLVSTPALADDHGRDRRSHGRATGAPSDGQAQRAQPRHDSAAQRPEGAARRPEASQQRHEAAAPRAEPVAPRQEPVAPRQESRRETAAPRAPARGETVAPRAVPRSEVIAPHTGRPPLVEPRAAQPYARPYYAPRHARPYYVRPYHARPYYVRPYVFRPHLRLNFGVFVGYPFAYGYAYPYPVPVYGYGAPVEPVVVGPGSAYYGGVSLEFTPGDASVFVDGNYAGIVEDFDGTRQPLNLAAGTHRIELQAPGYEPLTFDVAVQPGQVVPYRGDMVQY